MNRRNFFRRCAGALLSWFGFATAANGGEQVLPAILNHTDTLPPYTGFTSWRNYTFEYKPVSKAELMRKLKIAMKNTKFYPPQDRFWTE